MVHDQCRSYIRVSRLDQMGNPMGKKHVYMDEFGTMLLRRTQLNGVIIGWSLQDVTKISLTSTSTGGEDIMFTRKGRIFQSDDYKTLWIDRSGKGFIDTQYTPVGSTLDVARVSSPLWEEMRSDDQTIRFMLSNFHGIPVLAPKMFPTELLAPIMPPTVHVPPSPPPPIMRPIMPPIMPPTVPLHEVSNIRTRRKPYWIP